MPRRQRSDHRWERAEGVFGGLRESWDSVVVSTRTEAIFSFSCSEMPVKDGMSQEARDPALKVVGTLASNGTRRRAR